MSGWIKWEKDLDSDPRVLRMARELKRLCNAPDYPAVTLLCGALVRLWSYADTHIREDDTLDLGCAEIDELIGIENFCSLVPADWLREIDEHTVELPGFQAHNGVEAKKRALTQKRVQKHRNAHSVTEALPDQDQTKTKTRPEEKGNTSASPPRSDIAQVFAHWQREWNHPTAKLDDKRGKRIQARLKDFTAEQLCQAISGFKHSTWHNGTDPKGNGTVYDGIDTLLRDTEQVEKGLQMFLHPPRPPPKADELSPIDRVRLANGVKRDEQRVVAEQFGQSNGDLDSADGDVRRSSYAGFRRLGS